MIAEFSGSGVGGNNRRSPDIGGYSCSACQQRFPRVGVCNEIERETRSMHQEPGRVLSGHSQAVTGRALDSATAGARDGKPVVKWETTDDGFQCGERVALRCDRLGEGKVQTAADQGAPVIRAKIRRRWPVVLVSVCSCCLSCSAGFSGRDSIAPRR